jgi:uncharacterized protein (TIGR02118 family)
MIRVEFMIRRKAGLSLEEFQHYWLHEHGPLVASFQRHLGIIRYVQSHRLDDPLNDRLAASRGGMEPPYDGVAELWFQSEHAFAATLATPEARTAGAALVADEPSFIDLAASPLWLAYELPQVNPTPENIVAHPRSGIVKLHFPLRHLPSLDFSEAQRYWRMEHGPLIRSHAPASGLLRYVQVHRFETPLAAALSRGSQVEPYTGHAEAWFDRSLSRSSPEAAEAGRQAVADETRFIDFARSAIWVGKEHVIVDRR